MCHSDGAVLATQQIRHVDPAVYDAVTGDALPASVSEFLAFSPDGTRIAVGGAWGWTAILDAATGDEVLALPECPPVYSWVWAAAWSPDGAQLATTCATRVRVWDAGSGDERLSITSRLRATEAEGRVTNVAWSPDGTRIATASRVLGSGDAGITEVWDAATGSRLLAFHDTTAATWSPDGTWIATAGPDGTVRIWDAATGDELATLTAHTTAMTDAAWSPDGSRLATASLDGTARIWLLRGEAPPPLTATPSPIATPSAAPSPTAAPVEVGSFRVVASRGYWGSGWVRSRAEVASLLSPISKRGDYQAADDPCTEPVTPDLPDPEVYDLEAPGADVPAEAQGVSRVRPHGVLVVYRADEAVLHEAFGSIVEQIGQCVVDLPFREQGRDGMIQVQLLPVDPVGDERVAVKVSDVGPDSSGLGWTADYHWIGFAREGERLVGVALNEAWRGDDTERWPDDYPRPTIADGELALQLTAALAGGAIEP